MIFRTATAAAVAILALSPLCRADFAPSAWQYRKRIPVEAGKPISAVNIDRQVFGKAAPDYSDIRIVRGSEEVPYLINRLGASREAKSLSAQILDSSASGGAVQYVLSLEGVTRHSRITLTTRETNFKKKLKIEASADNKSWALVRKEAYIFDFTFEGQHSSILSVEYPVSTRPYLRVTIEGWEDPAVLTGASVSLTEERAAVRQVVQDFNSPAAEEDAKAKATIYTLDFGENGIPKDLLRVELGGDRNLLFHRAATVETSEDNKIWSWHGSGVVYRVEGEESLFIHINDTRHRYLKLRLFHGDDKPLPVKSIIAEAVIRRVIFPVTAGGDYWLYYGNPNAKAPAYDLPMVLARSSMESAAPVNATAEETNPGYTPPPPPVKPFSDRYPGLLYGVLGVAVLAIGYLTVRFMQKASSTTTEPR